MSTSEQASVTIQASPEPVSVVPPWFGEVAIIANYLTRLGMLTTISNQVRFAQTALAPLRSLTLSLC
ncbi:MAG TPA: hypothetical protein VIY29_11815 [Ktedonobacteraceae bacterium]